MRSIVTQDSNSTRFHACERFDRCEQVKVDGRASHTADGNHVVYINPVTMGTVGWDAYVKETLAQLERRERPNTLVRSIATLVPL